MGQYYKPVNTDKKQWVLSHDYDNGLKLMEHSYIGNSFMDVVENLLKPGGKWHKCHLVWAGDYADKEMGSEENIYQMMGDDKKIAPYRKNIPKIGKEYRYIVNHTTREFVDKDNVKEMHYEPGWKIHPLSLLTCEGNGLGGGDFYGEDSRIGMWARNLISIEKDVPKGFTELDGTFVEER